MMAASQYSLINKSDKFLFCCERVAMRNRSVVFVIRDKKILMEKLCYEGRTFYSIPGGGIEDGETPEQMQSGNLKRNADLMAS